MVPFVPLLPVYQVYGRYQLITEKGPFFIKTILNPDKQFSPIREDD